MPEATEQFIQKWGMQIHIYGEEKSHTLSRGTRGFTPANQCKGCFINL